MATIPIVNTFDKRVGIVASVVSMTVLIILLLLVTFEFSDPPPKDPIVYAETVLPEEIVLEDLKIEASGNSGTPTDDPIDEPKPQTQHTITNPDRPDKEPTGNSSNTNANNQTNTSSTPIQSNNPFGSGGNDDHGGGMSHGDGDFNLEGDGGVGEGGSAKPRQLIKVPDWSSISRDISTKVTVTLNVTIDTKGNVVHSFVVQSKTTTSNNVLIQKIRNLVESQARFNTVPGNGTTQLQYAFVVNPQ